MLRRDQFPWMHHARMLADETRLMRYAKALEEIVRPADVVVDIGTGTGILAALAARAGAAKVYGIEYRDDVAELARALIASSGLDQIEVLQGRSYDLTLPTAPDVLLTETMGLVGPEENIVEICADLVARHPSISEVIPSRLSVLAQPVKMPRADGDRERLIASVQRAGDMSGLAMDLFTMALAPMCFDEVRYGNLAGSTAIGNPVPLVAYDLGRTLDSAFAVELDFPLDYADGQAFHLYFEARLAANTWLSTRFDEPATHWMHSYVKRPAWATRLYLRYDRVARRFAVEWRS